MASPLNALHMKAFDSCKIQVINLLIRPPLLSPMGAAAFFRLSLPGGNPILRNGQNADIRI
jgi:hypothetical protein